MKVEELKKKLDQFDPKAEIYVLYNYQYWEESEEEWEDTWDVIYIDDDCFEIDEKNDVFISNY